jgi:hypothetical protein
MTRRKGLAFNYRRPALQDVVLMGSLFEASDVVPQ